MAETIQEVTGKTAGEYFARLDALVAPGTVLYVYENLGNLERDVKMWGVGT